QPVSAQSHLNVYYVGPQDGVYTTFGLSDDFDLVTTPDAADVIVLNGEAPDPTGVKEAVQRGAGIVVFFGPNLASGDLAGIFDNPIQWEEADDAISLASVSTSGDPIVTGIVWTSAPQVRERAVLQADEITALVTPYQADNVIVGRLTTSSTPVYVFSPYLGDDNPQIQQWAYFHYLVYSMVIQAGHGAVLDFGDYSGSPVPHPREQAVLLVILSGIILMVGTAFYFVRRYSQNHPELLDQLISDPSRFSAREAGTDWERVGFHRPLGGFLVSFLMGLFLFIPLIIYQNLVLPVYILPSAQALGIWGRVVQFFNFLWLLLDMGTSIAFIKYFSEYRVNDPRRAVKFVQVFVWWQALSGAIQVGVVTLVAGSLLPHSVYALYAWSIIIHSLIQIPGFYQVFRHALMGWHRYDYAQLLDLCLYLVFQVIVQPIFVSLMVWWGTRHPAYGMAMGGLLGMGISAYVMEGLTFLLGFWMYRRLGYNARILFLAHFDWPTIKAAFRFGVFEMIGSIAWALGQAGEIVITQTRLVNYTEVWGNWVLAQNFIFGFQVIANLFNNVMPTISEAISHSWKILSQYYTAVAYKWGAFISAYIAAVLLAVADRFILGASGVEFERAAVLVVPLVIWGAIQYPSWVADNVQLASDKPYLKAVLVTGEQIIRLTLAFVLLQRLQITALIVAYFVGLMTKDLVGYLVNHKTCFPQRFFTWQSLIAPLLAGGVHYLILRWVTGLIWTGDQITSVLIFLIGILISYPLYTFLYGLFGGWDRNTLDELKRAVGLTSFMRPFAWLFWKSTSVGASISPLHDRFPIDIYTAAMQEADYLTEERVKLIVEA
ncbi:MAG TPA: lipopolysaccharide biosynthesis protein, partial [Anaerolineaceae bacterium]|nr:lipopolysaccharide biosynthesis protein [Anaerolineaceae bacterium]